MDAQDTSNAPDDDSVWLTPASLRVLAHPLRSRLLGALRRHGPSTATDLATLLGTNSGATSYHLRKLESVGLVQDTERARASGACGGRARSTTRGTRATSRATRTPRPPSTG